MTPRLSIVVPYYNVEQYIEDCLESLVRQSFTDFEVILVDDGSPDGSVDIAKAFCERDPRFRIVTQENQGLGPARNTGVRHAQGEYISFVDSDDLIPRSAYELMVRSLDETSSSLAGGNARRFNNTAGIRQSYVHRISYAKTRKATHIFDQPSLAIDRMVWAKVFRRTFWDQFKYEFPAIRYEDYPVTLRAHLDAVTVDLIGSPVYYWRERESGESITQLKFHFGNIEDRVKSAEMVLDLIEKRAPELRADVHKHLAAIDLVTVVQAFGTAADHELTPLLALGKRLSNRLDPAVLRTTNTFQRLEYEALQSDDAELLQRLARFRADGGLKGGVRARRHPRLPWKFEGQYPGLHSGSKVSSSLFQMPRAELKLRAAASNVEWTDDELVVHGTAEIAHLPTSDKSTIKVAIHAGSTSRDLPVERLTEPDTHGEERPVGFVTRIPRKLLASLFTSAKKAHLTVELRNEGVRRKSGLAASGVQYPSGAWVDGTWVQPLNRGRLSIEFRKDAVQLTQAHVDGDGLRLAGRFPSTLGEPELRLNHALGNIKVPIQRSRQTAMDDFTAFVPLDDLIGGTEPDDPFLERTVLVPRLYDGEDDSLLLITGLDHGVLAERGGRVISVSRSPGMYLNLIEGPARVTADDVVAIPDATWLTVSGPRWPGVDYRQIAWRRFLVNSDEGIDAPAEITLDDERWTVATRIADLSNGEDLNWTLFASPEGGRPYAVQTDSFLLSRLPRRLGKQVLRALSGTLHLEMD
ncbi:glycosyltransferase family 2 protein [Actinoplanes solisilvae]|uniref:glycosyltransferase family 2 protein n=1 Tax=Actinoplanes solisilvae TaxID=2486853 RepID=UPI000FDB1462|nr:glycosyltransferase family 2 protein [Actinoplanes solisilvae]